MVTHALMKSREREFDPVLQKFREEEREDGFSRTMRERQRGLREKHK